MLRGLLKLTWVEIKVFLREPMGAIGTIVVPVATFLLIGRVAGRGLSPATAFTSGFLRVGVPVFAAILIAISAVLSLITIISIYREAGILKRLRATPLRPHTILTAHVVVKLLLTAVTLVLLILAGKRYYPLGVSAPILSFAVALLLATWSILSVGFVIASLVPTARFAQPAGALILYPMVAVSGLFIPLSAMPPALQAVARVLPITYAVRLLSGIWDGEPWSAHLTDVAALVLMFAVCVAISSRVFKWE